MEVITSWLNTTLQDKQRMSLAEFFISTCFELFMTLGSNLQVSVIKAHGSAPVLHTSRGPVLCSLLLYAFVY